MDRIPPKTFENPAALVNELKAFFGPRCTGIKINGKPNTFFNKPQKPMKFCQAVNHSFNVPIIMEDDILDCPGARRSIGLDRDTDALAERISKNADMPFNHIRELLNDVPVMNTHVNNILLGIPPEKGEHGMPDVFIIYTRPDKIMRFIHLLTRMQIKPVISSYNLTSICGSVFSRSYQNKEINISFGCPDSRTHGGVRENEVIVGLPYNRAAHIFKSNPA